MILGKNIYLILTHTGTTWSKIIKKLNDYKYSHVMLSLDDNFDRMYSFGRKEAVNSGWSLSLGLLLRIRTEISFLSTTGQNAVFINSRLRTSNMINCVRFSTGLKKTNTGFHMT